MKRIEFHPETEAEFAHHLDFYREKSAGLAAEFVDAVEQAVSFVRGNPEAGSPASGELRRWRVRRFPFTVIYREEADRIYVLALAHHRQRPGYWRHRV